MKWANTNEREDPMIESTTSEVRSVSPTTRLAPARGTCSVLRMPARTLACLPLVAGLLLPSCSFERPPRVGDDDAGSIDSGAMAPDAETGCVPNQIICDDATDRYTECDGSGVVTRTIECPLGCSDSAEKCVDVDPSNGVAQYLDMAAADPDAPDLTLGAGSTIDTTNGIVFDGGQSVVVPSTDVGDHRVFMVKSLSVTGATKVTGTDGLIVVADGDVAITALFDVSADRQSNGPGGAPGTCDGADASSGVGPAGGGGGAGNGDPGATGGSGNNGNGPGGVAGPALSDVDLEPLRGGCEGGQGVVSGSTCKSGFGGGGGALQIVSRTEIRLSESGVIDASGGGGVSAKVGIDGCTSTSIRGGGGGGAGGSVLFEAPQVLLDGAGVIVSTKGGGGSGGGIGNNLLDGADGGTDDQRAAGGTNSLTGVSGGVGGHETLSPSIGGSGETSENGGGGGGAVGRARFNTISGTINPVGGAVIRSKFSTSMLRTRLIP